MEQTVRFYASGEQAVRAIGDALARHKYHLVQSFDLQSARAQHPEDCDCQYIVALAYPPMSAGSMNPPHVLTAYSDEHTTLVTVHSDQGAGSEDSSIVIATMMEAAGEFLEDPCIDEPELCLPALAEA